MAGITGPKAAVQEQTKLKNIVLETIKRDGKLTFERFMEMALYYPELGYYNSSRIKIGAQGDFFTSPSVHAVFGETIGEQLLEMWEVLGKEQPFHIVEFGAGQGYLAQDILAYLKKEHPDFFSAVKYCIIEVSPDLAARQQELLGRLELEPEQAVWFPGLAEINQGQGFAGCVLANEVPDAFPVHRVRQAEEGLKEIYVDSSGDRLVEVLDKPSTPELVKYFSRLGVELEPEQTAEVNFRALQWIGEIGKFLKRGFSIIIDYGDLAPDLFSPQRFDGTLVCFRSHRLETDPFLAVGEQDITAHVDFTSLMEEGRRFGLETTGYTNQMRFLTGLGIVERVARRFPPGSDSRELYKATLAMKTLMLPGGMGEVFKVLVQHKGVEAAGLQGLKRGRSRIRP